MTTVRPAQAQIEALGAVIPSENSAHGLHFQFKHRFASEHDQQLDHCPSGVFAFIHFAEKFPHLRYMWSSWSFWLNSFSISVLPLSIKLEKTSKPVASHAEGARQTELCHVRGENVVDVVQFGSGDRVLCLHLPRAQPGQMGCRRSRRRRRLAQSPADHLYGSDEQIGIVRGERHQSAVTVG